MKAKKAIFEYRRLPGSYPGYYFDEVSDYFNGHFIPWFPLGVAMSIMSDANDSLLLATEITYSDVLHVFRMESALGLWYVGAEETSTEDGDKKLYPIGGSQWEWTIKEETP